MDVITIIHTDRNSNETLTMAAQWTYFSYTSQDNLQIVK
jgi:hypothetical protein